MASYDDLERVGIALGRLNGDPTPAMTRAEWNATLPILATLTGHARPDELHQQIAISNAALPDGDPRKLTRADVDLIRKARDETGLVALHELAAKLNALLPPDT